MIGVGYWHKILWQNDWSNITVSIDSQTNKRYIWMENKTKWSRAPSFIHIWIIHSYWWIGKRKIWLNRRLTSVHNKSVAMKIKFDEHKAMRRQTVAIVKWILSLKWWTQTQRSNVSYWKNENDFISIHTRGFTSTNLNVWTYLTWMFDWNQKCAFFFQMFAHISSDHNCCLVIFSLVVW